MFKNKTQKEFERTSSFREQTVRELFDIAMRAREHGCFQLAIRLCAVIVMLIETERDLTENK